MSEASEQPPGRAARPAEIAPPPMPSSSRPSAVELRRLVLALVRAGRTPEALSCEFEPSIQDIWNWVMQVAHDAGRHADGLTTAERDELKRLRREVRQLREERDRPAEADRWLVREIDMIASGAAD
jgi:transposase